MTSRNAHRGGYRVGIDIGGTFTDLVVFDEKTGEVTNLKGLTTPAQLWEGVVSLIDKADIPGTQISFVAHGTTVAINAVLERKGPPTAIITTEGFEDVLELRRGARTHLLDPFMEKPWMFIPRRWRKGIKERVLADGTTLTPLDKEGTRSALRGFHEEGIQSVAVCLLNSYTNPAMERLPHHCWGEGDIRGCAQTCYP